MRILFIAVVATVGVLVAARMGHAQQTWRLSAKPTLVIGTIAGEAALTFGRIGGAVRLSTGAVVVADQQASEIRFLYQTVASQSGRPHRQRTG